MTLFISHFKNDEIIINGGVKSIKKLDHLQKVDNWKSYLSFSLFISRY